METTRRGPKRTCAATVQPNTLDGKVTPRLAGRSASYLNHRDESRRLGRVGRIMLPERAPRGVERWLTEPTPSVARANGQFARGLTSARVPPEYFPLRISLLGGHRVSPTGRWPHCDDSRNEIEDALRETDTSNGA